MSPLELGPFRYTGAAAGAYQHPVYEGLPFNGHRTDNYQDHLNRNANPGTDLAAPLYTRIQHMGPAGTIYRIDTDPNRPNGYAAFVQMEVGKETFQIFYLHMAEPPMDARGVPYQVGAEVTRGQMLGRIGVTGNTNGPHTHVGLFRITQNPYRGAYVDAESYTVETLTPEVIPEEPKPNGPITVTQAERETWVVLAEHGSFQHTLDSAWRDGKWEYMTFRRPTDRGGSF